jgi:hypothetical protein
VYIAHQCYNLLLSVRVTSLYYDLVCHAESLTLLQSLDLTPCASLTNITIYFIIGKSYFPLLRSLDLTLCALLKLPRVRSILSLVRVTCLVCLADQYYNFLDYFLLLLFLDLMVCLADQIIQSILLLMRVSSLYCDLCALLISNAVLYFW